MKWDKINARQMLNYEANQTNQRNTGKVQKKETITKGTLMCSVIP